MGLFDERDTVTPKKFLFAKNMVRNYSKAICRFCMSPLSKEYLEDIIRKFNFSVLPQEFIYFISKEKKTVESIPSLKKLLLITEQDSLKVAECKKIFIELGIIFIKFFSVKWIFSSRLSYKNVYIKFRYSFERRLKNPELFQHMNPYNYLKKINKGKTLNST